MTIKKAVVMVDLEDIETPLFSFVMQLANHIITATSLGVVDRGWLSGLEPHTF